ncbi:hypothetical protein, partial [Adlercreutzia caecimuris]|uniref:hypothetical protein n=1 Tax=Adlercreutzia caecimuris TaxID=671266 RepID=UPI00272AD826
SEEFGGRNANFDGFALPVAAQTGFSPASEDKTPGRPWLDPVAAVSRRSSRVQNRPNLQEAPQMAGFEGAL